MRRGGGLRCLWGLAGLLMATGCGHNVTPTAGFDDPGSIPRPENVQATSFHNSVAVTWFTEPGIFAFVDGWNVYRTAGEAIPGLDEYVRINPQIVQRNDYRDEDVVDGTRYWYVVTSMSPSGIESVPTDPVSVRVDAAPPDSPPWIEASVRFNTTLNRYEVLVNWGESSAGDLHHYNLYRTPSLPVLPVIPDLFDPRWVDDEVDVGTAYKYWVTAVDGNLNESAAVDTARVEIPQEF